MKELSHEQKVLLRQQAQLEELRARARGFQEAAAQVDARLKPLQSQATQMMREGRHKGNSEYMALGFRIKDLKDQRLPYNLALAECNAQIGALKRQIEPQVEAFLTLEKVCPDEAEHTTLLRRIHRACKSWALQERIALTPQEQQMMDSIEVALGERSFLHEKRATPTPRPAPDQAARAEQTLRVIDQIAKSKAVGLK